MAILNKLHPSDGSMTTLSAEGKYETLSRKETHSIPVVSEPPASPQRKGDQTIAHLKKLMQEHDDRAFSCTVDTNHFTDNEAKLALNAVKNTRGNGQINGVVGCSFG